MSSSAVAERRVEWGAWVEVEGWRFRRGRCGSDFLAEWEGALIVHADASGRVTSTVAAPGADEHEVRKMSEGVAVAFARSLAGKPSLHASAVSFGGQAVACLGASGSGKSTLAARLCEREGVALMADDVAAVEVVDGRWCVLPTESCHWIERTGSCEDKGPRRSPLLASTTAPLRALVALAFDEAALDVRVTELRGADAFARLYDSPLRFVLTAADWRRELDALTDLGARVPVFEIARSRAVTPPVVADVIFDLLVDARRGREP